MPHIEMVSVSKEVGQRTLLSGIDFRLYGGEVVGLAGANGSGKTTLLRVMAGLSRPSQGSVRHFGRMPGPRTRARIGLLLDVSFLYGDLTAQENLEYYAQLYALAQPRERVAEWLRRVNLHRDARDMVRTFSKGMRQRLAIARAALHDPDVLLLDEPFDGLDERHTRVVEELIRLWAVQGRSVVLVSHDRAHLQFLTTRRVWIRAGYLTAEALP